MTTRLGRRGLAGVAVGLGVLAAIVRGPQQRPAAIDVAALAETVEREGDHVTAIELAEWIKDRRRGLRVLDVRSAPEYAEYHIPTAANMPLRALPTAGLSTTDTIVLYSAEGAHAAQGWVFLQALGHRRVYFLRGGLADWLQDVMNPSLPEHATPAETAAFERAAPLARYFGGVPRKGAVAGEARPGEPSAIARTRRRGC